MHVYEVRPRKDKRGVDLISDVFAVRVTVAVSVGISPMLKKPPAVRAELPLKVLFLRVTVALPF